MSTSPATTDVEYWRGLVENQFDFLDLKSSRIFIPTDDWTRHLNRRTSLRATDLRMEKHFEAMNTPRLLVSNLLESFERCSPIPSQKNHIDTELLRISLDVMETRKLAGVPQG